MGGSPRSCWACLKDTSCGSTVLLTGQSQGHPKAISWTRSSGQTEKYNSHMGGPLTDALPSGGGGAGSRGCSGKSTSERIARSNAPSGGARGVPTRGGGGGYASWNFCRSNSVRKFCTQLVRCLSGFAGNNSKHSLFLMSNHWEPDIICSLIFKKCFVAPEFVDSHFPPHGISPPPPVSISTNWLMLPANSPFPGPWTTAGPHWWAPTVTKLMTPAWPKELHSNYPSQL